MLENSKVFYNGIIESQQRVPLLCCSFRHTIYASQIRNLLQSSLVYINDIMEIYDEIVIDVEAKLLTRRSKLTKRQLRFINEANLCLVATRDARLESFPLAS